MLYFRYIDLCLHLKTYIKGLSIIRERLFKNIVDREYEQTLFCDYIKLYYNKSHGNKYSKLCNLLKRFII